MIYAQIKNGLILNTIVCDEDTPLDLFAEGFDHFLRVDNLTPVPGIGWSYDGTSYNPPIDPETELN